MRSKKNEPLKECLPYFTFEEELAYCSTKLEYAKGVYGQPNVSYWEERIREVEAALEARK
jgi:hypothetical protein